MHPTPTREFELQPRTAAHAPGMFEVLRDPRLYTYLDYGPPESAEYLQSLYTRYAGPMSPDGSEYWLNWVILTHGECAGYVQATIPQDKSFAWVAYMLGHKFWGAGLATAATRAMLELLRADYQVTRFLACVEVENTRSIGLLRKLNFVPASDEELASHKLSLTERLFILRN
ncbi:MAG: GNAT family N-acetyltransferase [Burkholderiaceae bacterium]